MIRTLTLETGPLQENCYLLWRTQADADAPTATLIFDPGDEAARIRHELEKRKLEPGAFVLTHCHFDHIGALAELKAWYPQAPIYVPEAEKDWLQRPTYNLSYFMGAKTVAPEAEFTVAPDSELSISGFRLLALHIPGHSPGGTAYYLEAEAGSDPYLFAGDIIMRESIGRTDFPGSAGQAALVAGIQEKLFGLPESTRILPGHGPASTIGDEKRYNPFCALR